MSVFTLLALAIIGVGGGVYGYRRARSGKPSRVARYALGILAALFVGMYLAHLVRDESQVFLFAVALSLIFTALLTLAIAVAVGGVVYRHKHKGKA